MPSFKIRALQPIQTDWVEFEASSPEEAANDYWFELTDVNGYVYKNRAQALSYSGFEVYYFGLVEIEGWGETVVRSIWSGIGRTGGVKTTKSLAEIAKVLGWTKPPEELVEEGWYLEESLEEAKVRKKMDGS